MPIQGIGQFNFLKSQWKGLSYGSKSCSNQIAQNTGSTSIQSCLRSIAFLFSYPFQTRFYSGSTVRHFNTQTIFSNRLSWHNRNATRLACITENTKADQTPALHNHSESPSEVAKKRAFERLQSVIFQHVARLGLIKESAEVSIDSTGLESNLVSRHFLMRQGKRTNKYRRWTKLTIVCDNDNHLIPAATVSTGPNNDAPWLIETTDQAIEHIDIHRMLADSGFDSEENHRYCREELGIASTVIAVNDRYYKGGPLQGRYRRQMKKHFPKCKYRQRWQVESVFSRFKRRLGYALRSSSFASRKAECLVRVLTYNLMILYLLSTKSVYIKNCSLKTLMVST